MTFRKLFHRILFVFAFILVIISVYIIINADNLKIDEYLLYKIAGKTFVSDVYVMFPDKTLKKVSPGDEGIYYQANINSQGDKVVFFGNDKGPPQIWLADLKQSTVTAITEKQVGARHPVFSTDGRKIAYCANKGFDQRSENIELMNGNGLPPSDLKLNIYIKDVNGGNEQQVTFGPYQDQRPCFSPDGEYVAFISNRLSNMSLWKARIGSPDEIHPVYIEDWSYRPWFSSDGQWIYFFKLVNGKHRIFRISANGGRAYPIENDDEGSSRGPFFDSARNVLLMHSNRDGKWNIWELPLDKKPPTKIEIPGMNEALHATRSQNGIMAFDAPQIKGIRRFASILHTKVKTIAQLQ